MSAQTSVVPALDVERLRVSLERDLCVQLERDRAFQRLRDIIAIPDAKTIRRRLMASALLLSEGMAPEIHAHAREAMRILGVDKPIEIYQASGRENAAMHAVEDALPAQGGASGPQPRADSAVVPSARVRAPR